MFATPCVKGVQLRSFFWSVFSRIRTEHRDLLSKSPYSVRIRENTNQKKTLYLDTFHSMTFFKTIQTKQMECLRFLNNIDKRNHFSCSIRDKFQLFVKSKYNYFACQLKPFPIVSIDGAYLISKFQYAYCY